MLEEFHLAQAPLRFFQCSVRPTQILPFAGDDSIPGFFFLDHGDL